ncbi:pyridoxal-dependent decarboxylase [Hahella sp. CCB-MM4]|uniref:pyridoxal-dependent decarboxylase n=1 Tax=Hahella sp. (strain CCB-MM4) TaxID=1926491 RepID=UPI001AEF9035|nr:pyridoxal-dependent decarboxylase [Hahella sp. CCB-MM4]
MKNKTPSATDLHMTPEEFRRQGYQIIDWIADYWGRVEEFPVLSQVAPNEVRSRLPPSPPSVGESLEDVVKDLENIILPGLTHWQSPNFFAYFPTSCSAPSVLGELLCAGLGVQGMLWVTSPACTELETHVLDWLVEMLDLPDKFKSTGTGGGVLQDYASSATLCALLAARERATEGRSNRAGYQDKLVAYCSTQTHSSIEKAVRITGLGSENLRLINVNDNFAMLPDALAAQIAKDRQDGLVPCFVCATIGTTSSLAVDPVSEIGRTCQREGVWLHVDAAMAGSAAVCPEYQYLHQGLEHADSYCFNPHKWLLVNHDCDCFYVADKTALTNALSILPEYLKNVATETGDVIDYRDWQIPLGRRFRSLKLWLTIRYYGIEGLQKHIRKHVSLTKLFVDLIEESNSFELAAPPFLNLVCFRHKGDNQTNERILDKVNQEGQIYLTHTKLNGRYVLRFCIGQIRTEEHHVRRAVDILEEAARC